MLPIPLAQIILRVYVHHMITRALMLLAVSTVFVSCKDSSEKVEITETRELTRWDQPRTPIVPVMPPEWRQVPGTEHRTYNYRFGADGEVYISKAGGGVLANVNRWMKQYGQSDIASLEDLSEIKILGQSGVLVEATGRFGGGMGKLPRENAGLLGAIVDFSGNLFIVKMIGDGAEVMAEKERFIEFCEAIREYGTKAP